VAAGRQCNEPVEAQQFLVCSALKDETSDKLHEELQSFSKFPETTSWYLLI
jgi:hypothetical protein